MRVGSESMVQIKQMGGTAVENPPPGSFSGGMLQKPLYIKASIYVVLAKAPMAKEGTHQKTKAFWHLWDRALKNSVSLAKRGVGGE